MSIHLQVCLENFICFSVIFASLFSHWQGALGKISLTTDGWDDQSLCSFIAVTAHYLARLDQTSSCGQKGAMKLEGDLICFLPMPGHHFGTLLAKGLLFVTDRAGITNEVILFRLP